MKTLLTVAVLAVALVLSTGCGAPATPVTPTTAATATRAVPTLQAATPTRAPTVTPTAVPPTPAPTAVITPPTPTRPPATATRTRAPATKAPAVVPTKAAVAASPTPKNPVPVGQAGLLVRNYFGQPLFYTLPGQRETRIEGNSEMFFVLDPGTYTVTVSVPGQLTENLTFTLKANATVTQEYYAK